MCTSAEALMKPEAAPFVCAPSDRSRKTALRPRARPTLPRPPQPVPTFVTMANAPLLGRDGGSYGSDLGETGRDLFWGEGTGRVESD